jgi:hypothetical protein
MAWSPVEQMSGCGERLGPEGIGHAGVHKKTAYTIIECANDSLGFAILSRSVWGKMPWAAKC